MHAFDVLGDPVRRRILELLMNGEATSGSVTDIVRSEFAITQPTVSQHLKVLRDGGFVHVRVDGPRRYYTLDPAPLRTAHAWLDQFQQFWDQRLDALDTELARSRHRRRRKP